VAAQSQTTVKALGLNINPNFLDLPNGSLVVANDVIIRRENVIESRRGLSDWSDDIGTSVNRMNQLFQYKDRILTNYSNKLAFESGTYTTGNKAIFDIFDGAFSPPGDYRMRAIEANKNFYFTSSNGIKKISARTADDFSTSSGYIRDAGAVKAIDFTTTLSLLQGETGGFLPVNSAVAYRIVWGYKDVNDNLILGAPSSRNVVYNYGGNAIVLDFNTLLTKLDLIGGTTGSGLITDTDFYSTLEQSLNASGIDLKNAVVNLAEKLDNNLLFADDNSTPGAAPLTYDEISMDNAGIVTVTFSAGDPTDYISVGDSIEFTGLSVGSGATDISIFNGEQTVTFVDTTSIKFIYQRFNANVGDISPAETINAGATLNSYAYQSIVNRGDGNAFSVSLEETPIDSPPTAGQLQTISNTILRMVARLAEELPDVISAAVIADYITPFTLTESGNVDLNISIPTDSQGNTLSSDYFMQIYRTNVFNANNGSQFDNQILGITIIPDDEMHLVYEYFPTTTDYSNGYILYEDTYPDELAQNNTPLYTNPVTGDGILQSNDIPPYAQDITFFKNYTFYANTKTRHLIANLQLIGVDNIVSGDKITIANVNTSSTYTFVDGVLQVTRYTVTAASAAALKTAIEGNYFDVNSANDLAAYRFWYNYDGATTAPAANGRILVAIDLITGDTVDLAIERTADVINNLIFDFTATFDTGANTFTITNVDAGTSVAPTIGNISGSNLAVSVTTTGVGEDVATGQVLVARTASAATNIDLTARSFIRIINGNATSPVYAYYISGENSAPGQISLESKVLSDTPFYVIASGTQFNSGTQGIGTSFTPDISPIHVVPALVGNIIDGPTGYVTLTTPTAHGLQNGFQVIITNSNSDPIVDGIYTVYNVTPTTFDILHSALTTDGTKFSWELTSDSVVSNNSTKPNRVYYSKFSQPEAVPLLNYFDIGPEDQSVLRIFPLRTSLFVFKEDGVYRIAGEVAPFTVQLFDSSCIMIAPDTLDVTENNLYCWTTKGITNVTESGTAEISTPVDIDILRLATYPQFKTVTWGVGYNSDNSYTVFTNKEITDEVATIGYRFSTLTNTWTNVVRSQTCGIIKTDGDVLYTGSGVDNIINKERKSFTRTDYADKDFELTIQPNFVTEGGTIIQFPDVSDIDIGDVLYQNQYLTIYKYNMLLQKLDIDPGVSDDDYFDTLEASIGDNMRTKLEELALKLDADPGVNQTTFFDHIDTKTLTVLDNSINNPTVVSISSVTELVLDRVVLLSGTQSPSSIPEITGEFVIGDTGVWGVATTFTIPVSVTTDGGTGLTAETQDEDFRDIEACFNAIIDMLNNDSGVSFTNYSPITENTPIEAVVIAVNNISKKVTLNITGQWIQGPVSCYKAIPCQVLYSPLTFGDVLKYKQIFEATAMFSNTAFTQAKLGFSSDLKPNFVSVNFSNYGNGIFGSYSNPGFGFGYFGGGGNAKPFRTFVPRHAQRCRFINMRFDHRVAREGIALYGVTLTGNLAESTRAYR